MNQSAIELPDAAALLGAFVDAFQLRSVNSVRSSLSDKQAQRYFAGHQVSPEAEDEILWDLVEAFLAVAGPARDDWAQGGEQDDLVQGLTRSVRMLHRDWNRLRSDLSSAGVSVRSVSLTCGALVRLYTIDLALRAGAGAAHLRLPAPESKELTWLDGEHAGWLLRSYLQRTSPPLTQDRAVKRLGCAKSTMDGWLNGSSKPRADNVLELAQMLSEALDVDEGHIQRSLSRHYGFLRLLDPLAVLVNREGLREAFERWIRYTKAVRQLLLAAADPVATKDILVNGAHASSAATVIHSLLETERAPLWHQELLAVTGPWEPRLRLVLATTAAVESPADAAHIQEAFGVTEEQAEALAALKQRLTDSVGPEALAEHLLGFGTGPVSVPPGSKVFRVTGDALEKSNNRALQGEQALARGDIEHAAYQFEKAVQWKPDRADLHFKLGHCLSLLGEASHDEGLFRRAEHECRIAAVAEPDNEVYMNEVAAVMLRGGRPAEVLEYLDSQDPDLIARSGLLSHNRGKACALLEQWGRAIQELEVALTLVPGSAMTLDELAHCLLVRGERGDRRRGVKEAKRAARLGVGQTLAAYERGEYG